MRSVLAFSLFLFLLFSFSDLQAKNEKYQAEYHYKRFEFHEAIPFYEAIAKDESDPELYAKLADCYKFTGNFKKAKDNYSKAVKLEGVSDNVLLHYGQLLMQIGEYEGADTILKKYQKNNDKEVRVANLIESCKQAPALLQSKPKGSITFLSFNTNGSEFAPSIWRNNVVFTADYEMKSDKKNNKIDNFTYTNIYFVSTDENGKTGKEFHGFKIPGVTDKSNVGPATFSSDGKVMYFTQTKHIDKYQSPSEARNGVAEHLQIMFASDYDSIEHNWNKVEEFQYNNSSYSVAYPTISPDGRMLVFASDMMNGFGGTDLWYCTKNSDDEWSEPVNAGSLLNTEGEDVFPYFADDETLFFSSDSHIGLGGLDIYMTKWDAAKRKFSAPVNVGLPYNSSYDDISLSLRADHRSSYFSSNRPEAKKGDNIYFFNRSHSFFKFNIVNDMTQNPISDAKLLVQAGEEKREIKSDYSGKYYVIVYPDIKYKIQVSKKGYGTKVIPINTDNLVENDTLTQTITLSPNPVEKGPDTKADSGMTENNDAETVKQETKTEVPLNEPAINKRDSTLVKRPNYLKMTVVDAITNKKISNVQVNLESVKDNREIDADENGRVLAQLFPDLQYTISLSKAGYEPKKITLISVFVKDETDTTFERVSLSPLGNEKVAKVKNKKMKAEDGDHEIEETPTVSKKHKRGKYPEADKRVDEYDLKRSYSVKNFHYEYNRTEIATNQEPMLEDLISLLNDYPTMHIQINGYADCRGSAEYNMKLSTERAHAVVNYLIKKGFDAKRLKYKGYGKTKPVIKCPVCKECTDEQHEKNRGIEFVILKR